jgi:hypothetical protein
MDIRRTDVLLAAGFFGALVVVIALPVLARGRDGLVWSAAVAVTSLVLLEIVFRVLYRRRTGKPYRLIPKLPFHRIYFEPHPYLPYVYKSAFATQDEVAGWHPLNRDKGLRAPKVRTNSRGWLNGPGGDREVAMPKPPGLIRICCLGASTTVSYLKDETGVWSYPLALERCLATRDPGRAVEVNNCGVGGYTSAEVLIKFLLDVVDTEPDPGVQAGLLARARESRRDALALSARDLRALPAARLVQPGSQPGPAAERPSRAAEERDAAAAGSLGRLRGPRYVPAQP